MTSKLTTTRVPGWSLKFLKMKIHKLFDAFGDRLFALATRCAVVAAIPHQKASYSVINLQIYERERVVKERGGGGGGTDVLLRLKRQYTAGIAPEGN